VNAVRCRIQIVIGAPTSVYLDPPAVEFDEIKLHENRFEDDDHDKYKKEYDAKWPTGFFLQYSVLTRRYALLGRSLWFSGCDEG